MLIIIFTKIINSYFVNKIIIIKNRISRNIILNFEFRILNIEYWIKFSLFLNININKF